jgi:NitT/TauT family transport system substrate-binding protein
LKALDASGAYKDQKVAIAPIKSGRNQAVEVDPLLSKDIRFFFQANSSKLDMQGPDRATNEANLQTIRKLLQISPGSTVLLRGHVDDTRVQEFRKLGGDPLVRKMALEAMQLSKERAEEIKKHLIEQHGIVAKRLDIYGAGWNEPVSKSQPELNRRVEVHWFTLE